MLSWFSNYLANWTHSCTEYVLDEVVDNAIQEFPISFPDNTDAKIYLFIIVNKQLLSEDSCVISFLGKNFNDRREFSKQAFYDKKAVWKQHVKELPIPFASQVTFLIQGIANTPATPKDPWHIPLANAQRERIGLKPHGDKGFSGGGTMLSNDAMQVQKLIKEVLHSYAVPEERIPKITSGVK
jgi:hypothetical protein